MHHKKSIIKAIASMFTALLIVLSFPGDSFAIGDVIKAGPVIQHEEGTENTYGAPIESSYYDSDGKTFMTDLGVGNCIIDLSGITPEVSTTGYMKISDPVDTTTYGSGVDDPIAYVVYNKNVPVGERQDLDGTITATYKNGVTLFDGSKADLVFYWHDMDARLLKRNSTTVSGAKVVVLCEDCVHPGSYTTKTAYADGVHPCAEYNCTISVQKDGAVLDDTVFFFGGRDLDIGGMEKQDSGYWKRVMGKSTGFPEAMTLDKSTLASDIYLTTSSFLNQTDDGTTVKFNNGKTKRDTASFDTGFACLVKGQTSFKWSGNECTSRLFFGNELLARNCIATTSGVHKDGGEITTDVLGYEITTDNGNYGSYITAADGTTVDYTIKVKNGYKLGTVTVDDVVTVPTKVDDHTYTYSFPKIRENHHIDAQFTGPSVTYEWDGAHPDATVPAGETNMTPGSYAVDTTYTPGTKINGVVDGMTPGVWYFEGWDKTGTITVNEDTVIKGKWKFTPDVFVTYEWVGDHPDVDPPAGRGNIQPGDSYTVDTTFNTQTVIQEERQGVQPGYWTFNGWDKTGTITINDNTVIKGSWTFTGIYNVQYVTDGHGTITGITSESVEENGHPQGTTSVPATDYHFTHWTCDKTVTLATGQSIPAGNTILPAQIPAVIVTSDLTFTAHHSLQPYVAYVSDEHGQITGISGEYVEMEGKPAGTTEEPAEHYVTTYWTCDKDVVYADAVRFPAGSPLSMSNIKAITVREDLTFTVHHEAIPHVRYLSDENGEITGIADEYVNKNESPTGTTEKPAEHYATTHWTCDKEVTVLTRGETVIPAGNALTMDQIKSVIVKEDLTFTVHHRALPIVTYESDANGSITGIENEYVAVGDSPAGTEEEPAEHYETTAWTCDKDVALVTGATIPAGDMFDMSVLKDIIVAEDITLTIHHAPMPHVEYKSDEHGSITGIADEYVPTGSKPEGSSEQPDNNYVFTHWAADKNVTLDGGTVINAGNELTEDEIKNIIVTEDIVITAYHEKMPEVTYTSDEHGRITGKTSEFVQKGENATGTSEEPSENYSTLYWIADVDFPDLPAGEPIDDITSLPITQNTTFTVIHEALPRVIYTTDGHGQITGKTSEFVDAGEHPTGSEQSPSEGYVFTYWTCDKNVRINGGNVTAGTELTMDEITSVIVNEDLTFTAHYRPAPALSVIKTTDKDKYNIDETIRYTIKVKQVVPDTYASNVVIEDSDITPGVKMDLASVRTDKGFFQTGDNSFKVTVARLDYDEEVTITFNAKVKKDEFNAQKAKNTASATPEEPGGPYTDEEETPVFYSVTTEVIGGSITPSNDEIVGGTDFFINYEPDEGYFLTEIEVDGEDIELQDDYAFTNITDNHNIKVVFSKIPAFEITKEAGKSRVDTENDSVMYTAVVTNTTSGSIARGVVIEDKGTSGLPIDVSSLLIDYNGKIYTVANETDILADGEASDDFKLEESDMGFKLTSNIEIMPETPIEINYVANVSGDEGEDAYLIDGDYYVLKEDAFECKETEDILTLEDIAELISENKAELVFRNTVSVIAEGMDKPEEASADVLQNRPEIEITKEVDKNNAKVGDTLTYKVTVEQPVPDMKATEIVITDNVPEGLEIDKETVSATSGEVSVDGQVIILELDELDDTQPVELTYTVKALKAGELKNTAEVICKQFLDGHKASITVNIEEEEKAPVKKTPEQKTKAPAQAKKPAEKAAVKSLSTGDTAHLFIYILTAVCLLTFLHVLRRRAKNRA